MHSPQRPNLLFIFTDEQRQDTLGVYGKRLIKTPNLDALQELGLSEKTVTVFASDHGDMMGSRGLAIKGGHMYEETFKVPLFLRIPGLFGAVGHIRQPVSQIDLIPTLSTFWPSPPIPSFRARAGFQPSKAKAAER